MALSMNVRFLHGKTENMLLKKDDFDNGTFLWADDTERLYLKMNDRIVGITPSKEELAARKLKPLLCPCCGSKLDIKDGSDIVVKCDFCGTVSYLDSIYYKDIIECNKRVADKIEEINNCGNREDDFNPILEIREKLFRWLALPYVPNPIEFTGDYPIFISLGKEPIVLQFPNKVNDLEILYDEGFKYDEKVPKDVKSYESKLIISLKAPTRNSLLAEVYSIGYKEDITKEELDEYLNEFYDIYHKIAAKNKEDALHIIKEEFKINVKET